LGNLPIPVVKDERSSSTSNKFEPHLAGPEYVLDLNRESTSIFHDEFFEMENQWAMALCEALTLESNEKNSSNEHGNFTLEMPQKSCSFNATLESGIISAPYTQGL